MQKIESNDWKEKAGSNAKDVLRAMGWLGSRAKEGGRKKIKPTITYDLNKRSGSAQHRYATDGQGFIV